MELRPSVIGLVARDLSLTLAFYRDLGLAVPATWDGQPHVDVELPGGQILAFDAPDTITAFDASWTPPSGGHRVALCFACEDAAEIDAVYARMTASGHHGHVAPWDAFWGQRYAVLHDPDGTPVELFAPLVRGPQDGPAAGMA
jgi:catechol 2,3-dioxygenase-like lactoylglutathione lyase family enzyme